jgi:hypothetical protein
MKKRLWYNFDKKYQWARRDKEGYEVSTKGDRRFSAFNAFVDGKSIEYIYQVEYKGYPTIREGKGHSPKMGQTKEQSWEFYLSLWEKWATENEDLIYELAITTQPVRILTDMFATTPINQAHALVVILNKKLEEDGKSL